MGVCMITALGENYGQIRNRFGLLSKDNKRLETKKFLEFLEGEKINTIAQETGVPRTTFYQKSFILKDEVQERLIPFVIAADLALDLFDDYEQARMWIMTPNEYFFGKSPFQMAMRKQGEAVIILLRKWLGRLDAQAF